MYCGPRWLPGGMLTVNRMTASVPRQKGGHENPRHYLCVRQRRGPAWFGSATGCPNPERRRRGGLEPRGNDPSPAPTRGFRYRVPVLPERGASRGGVAHTGRRVFRAGSLSVDSKVHGAQLRRQTVPRVSSFRVVRLTSRFADLETTGRFPGPGGRERRAVSQLVRSGGTPPA